ncbi:hypothetical protein J7E96_24350 [Streptomyces sp. ISL-96]|nr:hypothetical protein [Streptomyces sp. ISL-96]
MDAGTLARVVDRLRGMKPLEAILDDIGDVLGNQEPREHESEEIAQRLRGDLMRLVTIAVAAADDDAVVTELIQQARTLRSEELPGDNRKAIGHLRRMARVTNDLLARLAETGTTKEAICRPLPAPGR